MRTLRRRVVPRRLAVTNAWVSAVGSGAPRGRDAIQRSASSSTGDRKQEPTGAASYRPATRGFAELGVLPDPADVGLECLGKPIGTRLKVRSVVKKDEVEPPQCLGDRAICHTLADDRREPFVERGRVYDFF